MNVEQIGDCTIYLGDCLEILSTLDKVDIVVTSPPYDNLRDYGDSFSGFNWSSYIPPISKSIVDGGVIMWNVADATIKGSETGTSFKQALAFMEAGLNLHDTMIYAKYMSNFPESVRYFNAFEYMFIFSNGQPKTFNPIKDRRNKWRGMSIHGTRRDVSGELKKKESNTISGKTGMRLNWWLINHEQECTDHPATMPYCMAHDHIETWSNGGDTILDPFMGSGTTGVACARMGRNFIGVELEHKYFDIACKRIEDAYKQSDLFIEPPKHMEPNKHELS
ncbi:MAG: DNA-methyltransferase [Candidatus Anammoxibacter sp.]